VETGRRCGLTASSTGYTNLAGSARTTKHETTMKTNINENSVSSSTQSQMILEYMMEGHSITPVEALEKFGCFRLGARIWELVHKEGYLIYKGMVKDPKTGKRYAQYYM
jgi:hypothetical protein